MAVTRVLLSAICTVVAFGASYPCSTGGYVDSYSNLPAAPVAPTVQVAAGNLPTGPIVQGHYSETAQLYNYRPSLTINNDQSNCPHQTLTLRNWHDPNLWPGGHVPAVGADVTIPAGVNVLISSCSVSPTAVYGLVTVPSTSKLVFADAPISFSAKGFNVAGSLVAGSETCRLRNKVTITVVGSRNAQPLPADPTVKGIYVVGTIDIHGVQYSPTWTRLAKTASAGDTWIFIQDVVNWQAGQSIVITTTELKDTREWHRNEQMVIAGVYLASSLGSQVSAIQLTAPLKYTHYGGSEYQAEVGLLSRNIVIQGDAGSEPTDLNLNCTDPSDGSTYQCPNSYLTGFGVHVMVTGPTAQGRFSGVEMYRAGQTNQLARYPIHFHLIGNLTARGDPYTGAYARDCSVHHSYFRCYAIHGTQGVLLSQNTAYDTVGHCFFLEDGVEELNVVEYNLAAFVQPLGPYVNPSLETNGDSFYAQYLSWYENTTDLVLPSDISAGCFYITNPYNDFVGNAASGGWTGFALPSLATPVKLFAYIDNMSPANRPFMRPFRGNSAHSSGFWFGSAGAIYVGGELKHVPGGGTLTYTAGRSLSKDTCTDQTVGTPANPSGCWTISDKLWLQFQDNKVFLANRGMQNWGNRAEIIRLEVHDVGLSMNVFGQVWIDHMLMECRSSHRPTWFAGCPTSGQQTNNPDWGRCNVRDWYFWQTFGGFQWYDVGQQHILSNSHFRNCNNTWPYCVYRDSNGLCSGTAVFTSLTHSDQFVPELMQITTGITYENEGLRWRYSTALTDPTGVTVSGRDQNWYDPDGSASKTGVRTMIGSARAGNWWKYNSDCTLYNEAWICALESGDSAASVIISYNPGYEAQIGSTICMNGGGQYPCPLIAKVYHFGMDSTFAYDMGVNAKVTGPLIQQSGGWFLVYNGGTPSTLTFTSVQVKRVDTFMIAIPYPSGTTFSINYEAASWCGTWAICQHPFKPASSIADVASGFGDLYYWDNAARTLYLRIVQSQDTFGAPGTDAPWTSPPEIQEEFTRAGQTLQVPSSSSTITIVANCPQNPCAFQSGVAIPAARVVSAAPTTTAPSPPPTTSSPTPQSMPGTTKAPSKRTLDTSSVGAKGIALTVFFTLLFALL